MLTKISRIFAFSAPFDKFSSILCRTPNSAQGGGFCAKFCVRRILTFLGKPPWHRTRHPGVLNLSLPSVGRLEWVPSKSCGSKQAQLDTLAHIHGLAVFADAWLKGLASGDQHRPTGSRSALEVCYA